MPPNDPKLCPDLKRALPADSDTDPPGYRDIRQPREILFGDGRWHPAEVRAEWLDRLGRLVVYLEWFAGEGTWGEAYIHDAARIRPA